jgi:hypothetical protein
MLRCGGKHLIEGGGGLERHPIGLHKNTFTSLLALAQLQNVVD